MKGATTDIRAKLSRGRKVVHMLDAFVKSAVPEQAGLLATWNLVKRVPQPRNGSTSPEPTPVPTPAPKITESNGGAPAAG